MPTIPYDHLLQAFWETATMTAVSGVIAFAHGLPLGLVLLNTAPGGIWANGALNRGLGAVVNTPVVVAVIVVLITLAALIQAAGDRLARRVDHQ